MHKCIVSALFASTLFVTVLMFARPAMAENVLRFTSVSGGAATMDPHSLRTPYNLAATMQVYEALLDIDSNLAVVPQLALSWKPLDPTTWEFDLRPDVRFHDGTTFSAEDVVFSIERARTQTSDFQNAVANIAAVEAIDGSHLRIATMAPDPLLWMRLSVVAIVSKAWAQAHDITTPADLETGEETYASGRANGTGPFMLEEFEPRGRWVLIRNPHWWGKPDYPDNNIDRIVHTWKRGEDSLAALVQDEIDLLQQPIYSEIAQIRSSPALKLVYRPKLLTVFFGFDQGSAELRSCDIKSKNPFKDKRVRQAVAHAIDMGAVLRPLMGELFIPAGMLIAPGVNGYAPELDQPLPYDPDRAKTLLREAGYPDGFNITLDCPSEWGDDETMACQGAAEQLGAVGIDVEINTLSTDQLISQVVQRRASDFFLFDWYSEPDSEGLLERLFQSRSNLAGYANPQIDALIEKIKTEMVTYARDAYLEEAWRIVTDDLVYLPVRHGVSVFAMRKQLDIPPDPWEVPRFRLARFKEEAGSAEP